MKRKHKKKELGHPSLCNTAEDVGHAGRFKVTTNGYMVDSTPDIDIAYLGYMGKDAMIYGLSAISVTISCTADEAEVLGRLLLQAAKLHKAKGRQFAKSIGE